MKYYFYTREGAETFQKLCKNCGTKRYYANGVWYIIIVKVLNFFGHFKTPIIPEFDSTDDCCFNAYQNIIELLKIILVNGSKKEQLKARELILTISKMQIDGANR